MAKNSQLTNIGCRLNTMNDRVLIPKWRVSETHTHTIAATKANKRGSWPKLFTQTIKVYVNRRENN